MTSEQEAYLKGMDIWFRNEKVNNEITVSNIQNANMQVELYTKSAEIEKERLSFDLKRLSETKKQFNEWCDNNDLPDKKIK